MKLKNNLLLVVVMLIALTIPLLNRKLFSSGGNVDAQVGGWCVGGTIGTTCGSTSKSSVENINDQTIITKNEVNQLSKQINESIANTIVKNASMSQALVSNQQDISMGNIVASGKGSKVDITTDQKQQATVDLSAVNITSATNQSAGTIMNSTLAWVKNNNSTDVVTKMEAAASAVSKTEFLAPPSKGEASVINKNILTTDTSNIQNISNILENQVENNFTTETMQEAIASVQNKQKLSTGNIIATEGGEINLNFTQEQVAKAMVETLSKMDTTNKIINNTLQSCGVTVDQSNEVTSATDQAGDAAAAAEGQGLGGLLSSLFSGLMAPIIIGAVIVIVIILFLIYMFK